jgi:small conductance mechanosensitive channel
MPEWMTTLVTLPLVAQLIQLLLVAAFFVLARAVVRLARRQVERRLELSVLDPDRRLRLQTLNRVGYGVAISVVLAITLIMGLQVVGLPIGPLLGSAGVVGLAISLGAQTLIRDYLGGIFILAEDQFRVGDQVTVSGVTGEVARMTMRVTYLRDVDGRLHTVPNGDIRIISNLTREWARAVVDLNLDYAADMATAQRALQSALNSVLADAEVKDLIIGEPDIVAWNNLGDSGVQVRLLARTLPGKQWHVARELRRQAVAALQSAGLQLTPPGPVWRSVNPHGA